MELSNAIQVAIQEQLPSAVAGELKDFITQSELTKRELKLVETQNLDLLNEVAALRKEKADLLSQIQELLDLEMRESAISKRENDLEVTLAKKDTEAAERSVDKMFELMSIAFRNPRLVHSETGTIPIGVQGNGQYAGMVTHSNPYQKTTTIEEV